MAQIMDGKAQAALIKERLKTRIDKLVLQGKDCPSMAVVQVGDDAASEIYIKQKELACQEVGMKFKKVSLRAEITQEQMLEEIEILNKEESIHGFIVQQPLPSHLNTDEILEKIDPNKDIDCLHPYNLGLIAEMRGRLLPCTPAGVIELLDAYDIDLDGKNCVIIGRSRIVGKPLGLMMLNRNATVTYCHSRTKELDIICRQADILAVAIGKAKFVTADMIKPGCVVIDIGVSRIENDAGEKVICGDVDYEDCVSKASYITPMPGGVGPMTVAMLVANGLKAYGSEL